ncbi:mycothione reductase, partial [Rhodococcus hoagii]|nr:mycothione reductase [Prescottella equi]
RCQTETVDDEFGFDERPELGRHLYRSMPRAGSRLFPGDLRVPRERCLVAGTASGVKKRNASKAASAIAPRTATTSRCSAGTHASSDRAASTGTGEVITADRVVIAAGSRPSIPNEVLEGGVRYHTNDDIMRLPELPERLVILGSGFIAAEFAHVFSALGVQVSIVGRSDRLLRHLDKDVSTWFTELAQRKWDVHLGNPMVAARPAGNGIELELADGTVVSGDELLVAVGRIPNGDRLDAALGGVAVDEAGRVIVDEYQRTTAEGVFALGDVSSPYQLKHVANHEMRVVQHNLLHDAWASTAHLRRTDHRFVPAAVFTDPQIADVGMTEEQAREAGLDITVKLQNYCDVAYGWAMEDDEGFCKVIAERGTGRLLGAHVIGAQAPTVIQPLIQALSFGLSAQDMATGQYWIHPALPEVVENALLGLDI